MNLNALVVCTWIASVCLVATADEHRTNALRPIMNVPDEQVYASDFSVAGPLDKSVWQIRQGTRWKVADGVLRGQQSSAEYQAQKADHKGFDPRIKSLQTPRQFIAKFSVRFLEGEETNLLPIIEFGHHNVRLKFSETGVVMLADHEAVQLAETQEVSLNRGVWHHVLAERRGDQFIVQFADGPTLYAKHKSLAIPIADQSDGLGIAGTRKGFVEIDNVTLWSIKPEAAAGWQAARAKLPQTAAKAIEKKSKKKKK
ncbi:MAG: hypothetical protein AB8B91_13255 [Rubripirellula sp.]